MDFENINFFKSISNINQAPDDIGSEVAFVGRSNAGKSSVLNVLAQQNSLARTSKTPGRTQHINVFALDDERRLIDLPGYGYAKVPKKMKEEWQRTLGGDIDDRLNSIFQTSDGGYVLAGTSASGISGDKTEASKGGSDYWIIKLSPSGNIEWQKTLGGNNNDSATNILQTADGGYIVTGNSKAASKVAFFFP